MGFASVVLDVDSTLCGIEGIDWLAEKAGEVIARDVAAQTERAMHGELRLEDVYASRLELVRPGRNDIDELGSAYVGTLAPGAAEVVGSWHDRGVKVVLVSGGSGNAFCQLPAGLEFCRKTFTPSPSTSMQPARMPASIRHRA